MAITVRADEGHFRAIAPQLHAAPQPSMDITCAPRASGVRGHPPFPGPEFAGHRSMAVHYANNIAVLKTRSLPDGFSAEGLHLQTASLYLPGEDRGEVGTPGSEVSSADFSSRAVLTENGQSFGELSASGTVFAADEATASDGRFADGDLRGSYPLFDPDPGTLPHMEEWSSTGLSEESDDPGRLVHAVLHERNGLPLDPRSLVNNPPV